MFFGGREQMRGSVPDGVSCSTLAKNGYGMPVLKSDAGSYKSSCMSLALSCLAKQQSFLGELKA